MPRAPPPSALDDLDDLHHLAQPRLHPVQHVVRDGHALLGEQLVVLVDRVQPRRRQAQQEEPPAQALERPLLTLRPAARGQPRVQRLREPPEHHRAPDQPRVQLEGVEVVRPERQGDGGRVHGGHAALPDGGFALLRGLPLVDHRAEGALERQHDAGEREAQPLEERVEHGAQVGGQAVEVDGLGDVGVDAAAGEDGHCHEGEPVEDIQGSVDIKGLHHQAHGGGCRLQLLHLLGDLAVVLLLQLLQLGVLLHGDDPVGQGLLLLLLDLFRIGLLLPEGFEAGLCFQERWSFFFQSFSGFQEICFEFLEHLLAGIETKRAPSRR
mmetsp:Transcript_36836/g.53911  ORF Transcript_36836/g.53911 Transcript_36836/m.53911 type:complete len:324 (+) Transcript_36836:362-1333(+)